MNYIHRDISQKEQPENITTDSRGSFIEYGKRVAYNKGGDVVIGTIVELKRNEYKLSKRSTKDWTFWNLDFELHVFGEDGNISKVKNPNCFVVI